MIHKIRLYGLAALPIALAVAACSKTTVEAAPQPAVGAAGRDTVAVVVAADTTKRADTVTVAVDTAKRDTTAAYQASGAGAVSGMTHTLTLTSLGGSNFTGQVVLTDLGMSKTRVSVTLTAPANVDKDADHNQHIHSGTCAAPGPVVFGLDDVEGNGKPTNDEVSASMSALMDGNHIVNVHEQGGDRAIACVDIPKQ